MTQLLQIYILAILNNGELHPKAVKVQLAKEIVTRFYSADDAEKAENNFEQVFARHETPDEIPEVNMQINEAEIWVP